MPKPKDTKPVYSVDYKPGGILTKEKALLICLELWTWLAETGSPYKTTWPGWEIYGSMLFDCPCCEYTEQIDPDEYCHYCPIPWPGLLATNCNSCSNEGSPYQDWTKNIEYPILRKASAKKMVVLIQKTIEENKNAKT
jgi:hypothetical protein